MDTSTKEADTQIEGFKLNSIVNEAGRLSLSFAPRNQYKMNMDSDVGNESDDTLIGDEVVERAPLFWRRQQRRPPAASFRELQTHTQNGRNFQVGRTFPDQAGNFRRVTFIKQHRASNRIVIESFQDDSHRILQSHSYDGRPLRQGKTVEMTNGTFLKIKAILEDRRTGDIFLKGFRYQRAVSLNGPLEFKLNEVVRILKLDKNDRRDILDQSMEVVELATVVQIRELITTNQQFPALSYREIDPESKRFSKRFIYDHCRLICRWKYLKVSQNEGFLKKMSENESDNGCSIPQDRLRYNFRGDTTKGGDSRGYTFGDGFCGCGGASRGAQDAGLWVAWGFDQDPHSIATYYANFPHAHCEGITANDFVTVLNEDYKVDILHLSPPCQIFSPAHTRPGRNDESNGASFLATEELIKKARPRIVTLEETFGLTRTLDNLLWFNAMIQVLTKLGFSVRWKVFDLQEYGLPQPRRRLFLIASW